MMDAWDILPFCELEKADGRVLSPEQLLSRWALMSRSRTSFEQTGLDAV